jgi:hypothetical protein
VKSISIREEQALRAGTVLRCDAAIFRGVI